MNDARSDPSSRAVPPLSRQVLLVGWLLFWALLFVLELQEQFRRGRATVGLLAFWEGTSFLVSTVIAWWSWSRIRALDPQLAHPMRWFAAALWPLPLLAPAFVVVVFSLRSWLGALFDAPYRHEPWGDLLVYESLKFSVFYVLAVAIVFGLRSYLSIAEARRRAEHARLLAQQAQLVQLAQQMAPHFLFNALNTIAATIHDDPDRAERLLMRLAALLRAASDLARQPVGCVADEVALAQGYAEIMHERFGDRVDVRFDVDPSLGDCRLPSLVLQPLLENAFRHGVEKQPGRCAIRVSVQRVGDRMRLTVEDDAGALDAQATPGVGLGNLQARLQALYGERASLSVLPRAASGNASEAGPLRGAPAWDGEPAVELPGRGVRATMLLPCE